MTQKASPLPWAINGSTITDARGLTVAKLTALDMANAELIVRSVNLAAFVGTEIPKCWPTTAFDIKHIKTVSELEVGKEYWLVSKLYADAVPKISQCRIIDAQGWKYFDAHIWAVEDNNQAMENFDIFGPVPERLPPDFDKLKNAIDYKVAV